MDIEEKNELKVLREILEGDEELIINPFRSLPEKNKAEALKYLYEQGQEFGLDTHN